MSKRRVDAWKNSFNLGDRPPRDRRVTQAPLDRLPEDRGDGGSNNRAERRAAAAVARSNGPGWRPRETDKPVWIAALLLNGSRLTHRQQLIYEAHPGRVIGMMRAILGGEA